MAPEDRRAEFAVIPAIDLKAGKCVRLLQGRDDATTVYGSDPVAVAATWVRKGARRLHVVNLDGAFGRASANLAVLARIARRCHAEVQYGGGLRSAEDVLSAFAAGVSRVVLGTAALESRMFLLDMLAEHGADRVIVALDAKGGKVTTRGWTRITERDVLSTACSLQEDGVQQILYTDVERDGMMTGPDVVTLRRLGERTGLRIIASGGVASAEDIAVVRSIPGVTGVIVGKALYEGRVVLGNVNV